MVSMTSGNNIIGCYSLSSEIIKIYLNVFLNDVFLRIRIFFDDINNFLDIRWHDDSITLATVGGLLMF